VFLNGIGGSRKGKKMFKMTPKVGSQKHKGQMQVARVRTLVLKDGRLGVTDSRRIELEDIFLRKKPGLLPDKWILHQTMPLRIKR
jgi:hypothetical protein